MIKTNIGLTKSEQAEIDKEVTEQLAREEFRLRSLAEADKLSQKVSDEIRDVLRKYGASLVRWGDTIGIVPPGFHVYSKWNNPAGVDYDPKDIGLYCSHLDCDHIIIKELPDHLKINKGE